MKNQTELIMATDKVIKSQIVQEVLGDLTEWFGLPEATEKYVTDCQKYPLWAIKNETEVIGFISLKETSPFVADIYCMGIKKAYHHQGFGKQLFEAMSDYCQGKYLFLQVKTVAEGHYPTYDKTIQFYKAMGFVEFEVFPTLWDEWNPCLVLVKNV